MLSQEVCLPFRLRLKHRFLNDGKLLHHLRSGEKQGRGWEMWWAEAWRTRRSSNQCKRVEAAATSLQGPAPAYGRWQAPEQAMPRIDDRMQGAALAGHAHAAILSCLQEPRLGAVQLPPDLAALLLRSRHAL